MAFDWVANIRCIIVDGKARLYEGDGFRRRCDGYCHDCGSFLGVDITQVGGTYLDGSCRKMQATERPGIIFQKPSFGGPQTGAGKY